MLNYTWTGVMQIAVFVYFNINTSVHAYFPLIFTCMGSHVLNLGHSSYLLL